MSADVTLASDYNELAYGLERGLNDVENSLSQLSAIPFVGLLITTPLKEAIGVTQQIAAVALGVFSIIPIIVKKDFSYTKMAINQFCHGLGNEIVPLFEFFPFAGTAFYYYRHSRVPDINKYDVCIITGHEDKFMPYMSLVNADWRIDGSNPVAVKAVKEIYAEKVKENGGQFKLTLMQKMDLARQAINEYASHK